MISNKHRYTILRASRLILAPFYSLIALFIKKDNRIIITASYNMEFSDNARALFEILIKHPEYSKRVFFVINDEKKRIQLNSLYPGRFISNTRFKDAIFILKSKFWFCSALELPLGTFFQRHIRQVIHMGHGMLYKKVGFMEKNISWYKKLYYTLINGNFSYTIATTEFCKKYIALGFGLSLDRVLITPQPKTGEIAFPSKIYNEILKNPNNMHVLYAPTWRPYADVELFPFKGLELSEFQAFLEENAIHIWLRLHPRFEQNVDEGFLKMKNIHFFSGKQYGNINRYLIYFDTLITDYSSIYYDFLTLKRPVLFFDYDLKRYCEEIGLIDEFQKIKCNETTQTYDQFKEQLLQIKNGGYNLEKVIKSNNMINYPIENSKIAKIILQKLKL